VNYLDRLKTDKSKINDEVSFQGVMMRVMEPSYYFVTSSASDPHIVKVGWMDANNRFQIANIPAVCLVFYDRD
jgi:hypothetical protein